VTARAKTGLEAISMNWVREEVRLVTYTLSIMYRGANLLKIRFASHDFFRSSRGRYERISDMSSDSVQKIGEVDEPMTV
jgi:hypothetical protein